VNLVLYKADIGIKPFGETKGWGLFWHVECTRYGRFDDWRPECCLL